MINERKEEQASLYVLGLLSAQEAKEFETLLVADAELRSLVDDLRAVTSLLPASIPQVSPPPHLKESLLQKIEERDTPGNVITMPPPHPTRGSNGWPWAIAAGFAVLGVVSSFFWFQQNATVDSLQNLAENRQAQIQTMEQKLNALQLEHDTTKRITDSLQQQVVELSRRNRLSEMRIALLGSLLEDAPKAVAVSVWDVESKSDILVVENLKPLPSDKDYQLWIIDKKQAAPIDAGVFRVSDDGKVRFEFKPKFPVQLLEKFAVTVEQKGGQSQPKGQMVLLGS